jgi:hypothetical protein
MKKLWIEDIELNPACLWQEDIPSTGNFIDKTNDVIAWYKYGKFVLDFDRYRYEMKAPFYALAGSQLENWPALSEEIKLIGIEMFFVPYGLRIPYVGDEIDANNWEKILTLTQGTPTELYIGRARTFDMMRICVAHKVRKEIMSMTDSQQMLKDVGQIVDWYIRVNAPDFKQWLTNEVGSPYENNGFAQKTYYSVALKDELYSIYNGNY